MAVLMAVVGYLSYTQISKVSNSFDVVKSEATPSIIALGNIKSDFNALHAAVLAFNLHVPEAATNPEIKQTALDHLEEVNMQKQNLLDSLNNYKLIEGENFDNEISDGVNTLVARIDGMTMLGNDIMNAEEDADHMAMAEEDADHMAMAEEDADHMAMAEEDADHMAMAEEDADHMAGHMAGGSATLQLHQMILEFNEEAMMFNEELDVKIEQTYESLTNTQANVLGDIEGSINLNMILTIAAVAIVFIVGGLAAYSITKRVSQLKGEANQVAAGNLSAQIATPGSDEITDLAVNFEHMRKSLVNAQQELSTKNKDLQTLNADLDQANQDLKKLDKLKDQFIGIASHELRGPIHPILGYASMAKSGKIQPQVALDVIHKQALKLRQLASDILDVSRMESGNLTYNMQKVKIHELLLNALVAAGGTVNPDNVSIAAKIDERNRDLEILADKDRIGQVFTNIIGNAVKFTRKGSITAETRVDPNSNTIEILISDTGGGIPEDILPNLFGKFVTKNVGDTNKEGTGLGLYISKAIIIVHGGTIEAYNSNGGATFRIVLPIDAEQSKSGIVAKMPKREHN
ncbi:MAG: signal transduction histidine kinase [Candidatus Nitrosomirales archaeon]|jgi:signal transduction histidine kinase